MTLIFSLMVKLRPDPRQLFSESDLGIKPVLLYWNFKVHVQKFQKRPKEIFNGAYVLSLEQWMVGTEKRFESNDPIYGREMFKKSQF